MDDTMHASAWQRIFLAMEEVARGMGNEFNESCLCTKHGHVAPMAR